MEEKKELSVNINPEVATGKYSNLAIITHSNSEFVLDFASMLPAMPKAEVVSRIIMNPEHAKRLLLALKDNVEKYEAQYEQITLDGQAAPAGIPFSNNGPRS